MNRNEKLQYVIDCVPTEALLAQLAEEAAELGHAALKLRRTMDDRNPTPVTREEAMQKLMEEIADVKLALETLGLQEDYPVIQEEKLDRWVRRLDWRGEDG